MNEHDLLYTVSTTTYTREGGVSTISFSVPAREWSIFENSDQWRSFLSFVQDHRKGELREQPKAR